MTLIDKLIQMQGSQLKEIPQSDSSVVVLADTKSFSVAKQNKAVFNILSPKKVVFMGSSNNQDATTRAERREEELERRRRRSPLGSGVVGGGAIAAMAGRGGGREGDPYADQIDHAISRLGGLTEKVVEVTGALAALRMLLKGLGITIPKGGGVRPGGIPTTTAAQGGSKVSKFFRGLLKGGQGLFKGFVETIRFLSAERGSYANFFKKMMDVGKGFVQSAGSGVRSGLGRAGDVVKNIGSNIRNVFTGGANFMKNLPGMIKSLPQQLSKINTKALANFLMTKGGKALLLGLKGGRIIGTLGLSLIADYFANQSVGVTEEINAANAEKFRGMMTAGMPAALYEKLQFQKRNKGMSAQDYHNQMASNLNIHRMLLQKHNEENPDEQLTEKQYIETELENTQKYVNPANNSITTFKSTTFAGLAGEHNKASALQQGTIDPTSLEKVRQSEVIKSTGKAQVLPNSGSFTMFGYRISTGNPFSDAVSTLFMGDVGQVAERVPRPGIFGESPNMSIRDEVTFEKIAEEIAKRMDPTIINQMVIPPKSNPETQVIDTTTRADDGPDLQMITNGGGQPSPAAGTGRATRVE